MQGKVRLLEGQDVSLDEIYLFQPSLLALLKKSFCVVVVVVVTKRTETTAKLDPNSGEKPSFLLSPYLLLH